MTYETFQKEILKRLQGRQLNGARPQLIQRLKCNGQVKCGIAFGNPDVNTSPTIYLEEYYRYYQMTGNLDVLVDVLVQLYNTLPVIQLDKEKLHNFSAAKDNIIMKLINTEENRAFLDTVPHIPFHDLSIVYYYLFGFTDTQLLDMPVNDRLLKEWGIDTLTLHRQAMENYSRLLPAKFVNLDQFLSDRGLLEVNSDEGSDNDRDNYMYFLTNEKMVDGAVLMTCKNLLDKIADFFQEDFYIIPGSIHEVILIPESKAPPKDELDLMIQEINRDQLKPEEFLSNHAYYYSKTGNDPNPYFIQGCSTLHLT